MSGRATQSVADAEHFDDRLEAVLRQGFGPTPDEPADPVTATSTLEFLRQRVGDAPDFLLRAAASDPGPALPAGPLPLAEPAAKPRYRIVDEIAHGGIGSVLRGRDDAIGRDVAIKVLLDCHAANEPLVERFLEEARIEGQLQHPGIVPVHEVGHLSDRRPFFTMKLVKGQTLAALLRDRATPRDDRHRLLTVFEKVADTIAYTHSEGVVHRDLKPSNIMVGAFGEVQVMDWGLAKVLRAGEDESAAESVSPHPGEFAAAGVEPRSETGSVMGTPAYMPPEQARGEIERLDERADVFALGAILCEILTGEPPYGGETARAIREEAAAGRLDAAFTRLEASDAEPELTAIARRCLAPDRDARPRDAGELAEALSGYLASVDERARAAEIAAAEARVKAAEERKARKLTLALAGAVLLVIAGGIGGFLFLESGRRDRVSVNTRAVDDALAEATVLKGQAQSRGEAAPWGRALEAAKRATALAGREVEADTRHRAETLLNDVAAEEAAARQVAARVAKDRGMVERLERIRLEAADFWDSPGDHEAPTDNAYGEAFRGYGIDVDQPDADGPAKQIAASGIAEALIVALDDWTNVRMRRRRSGVGADWRRLVGVAQAADRNEVRRTLRDARGASDLDAVRRVAAAAETLEQSPTTLESLGHALGVLGDVPAAIAFFRRARDRRPDAFWIHHGLGFWLVRTKPPQPKATVECFRAAVALRPTSATAWTALGFALKSAARVDEAENAFREGMRVAPRHALSRFGLAAVLDERGASDEALAAYEEGLRLDPANTVALVRCGMLLATRGETDRAIAAYEEAVRVQPNHAEAYNNLGAIHRDRGDRDKAFAAFERALAANPDLYNAHFNLSAEWFERGEAEKAIAACREALRVEPESAEAHGRLAGFLAARGEYVDARASYRKATELDPKNARYLNGLAIQLDRTGRSAEALQAAKEAVECDPEHAGAQYTLGLILLTRGDNEGAVEACEATIRLQPAHASARLNLGVAQSRLGRTKEAVKTLEDAVETKPDFTDAWVTLASLRERNGDPRGCIAAAKRALALDPRHPEAHTNLAVGLKRLHRLREAAAAYREAARLRPTAGNHLSHGQALRMCGEYTAATAAIEKAIRLEPRFPDAHYVLGDVRLMTGDLDAALAAYRETIRLNRKHIGALYKLGAVLKMKGRYAEALRVLRRGRALVANKGPFDEQITECERALALAPKLDARLRDGIDSLDARDRSLLAQIASREGRHADAARIWEATVAAGGADHRYSAACAAARAGAEWRTHALAWLRAELGVRQSDLGRADLPALYRMRCRFQLWKRDPDLASLRDETGMNGWPQAERQACRSLWKDVDALLERVDTRIDDFDR